MYYSDEVKITPKLSENALRVLRKKYLRGESVEEMFERVAKAVAGAEVPSKVDVDKLTTQFYNLMASLDFLPNSPTLMNAGRPLAQLAACFVVPVEDSMDGIFTAIKDMALIQKTGGGTGFDFSRLRPTGDPVSSTYGESSGPVSFMKAFNACTEAVKQGGARRGANMGILRVDHPDILEFINAKSDLTQLTNFNMSVAITNEFMDCYLNKKPFFLKFKGEQYAQVDPKEIMDLIVHRAWSTGEPGVVFIDLINKDNPTPDEYIESTNPCIVGDTLIKTVEGMISIKDLVGQEIDVYCVNDNYQLTIRRAKNIRMTRKNAQLLKVSTTKGEVICTPDHKFYTRNRGYVEAQYLKISDKLVALNVAPKNQKYTKVYLTGTGANVPAEHIFIAQHYYGNIDGKNAHHKDNNPTHNYYSNIEVLNHDDHSVLTNKGHADWMEHDSNTGRWLPKIKENKNWSNKLGIHPVGVNMRLLAVTPLDYTEDVYDMEVEDCHNFFANYVLIHNCGEQPLLPYEACNLGSINLANMVKQQPVLSECAYDNIDWLHLKECTQLATRFLDNVIDVNHYPLSKIHDKVHKNRKIGLGVMGWADLLFKLRIPYDSSEAITLASDIMRAIRKTSYETTRELAIEKGCFPNWENSVWYDMPMRNATTTTIAPTGTLSVIASVGGGIEPLFALYYEKDLSSGTIGEGKLTVLNNELLQAMETLGFSQEIISEVIAYIKSTGTLQGIDKLTNIPSSIVDLINIFKTASDISPLDHVRMQAAFQHDIDNAVSKTINFNNDVTEDDILQVIIMAWSLGCKGITVYRDGSRDTQPMTKGISSISDSMGQGSISSVGLEVLDEMCQFCTSKNKLQKRKRPKQVSGITTMVETGCGKMYVTVNYDKDRIIEVFCETGRGGGCKAFTEGASRLVSLLLRYDVPVIEIIDQLKSVRCDNFRHQTGKNPDLQGKSCPDVIGTVLQDIANTIKQFQVNSGVYIPVKNMEHEVDLQKLLKDSDVTFNIKNKCPECGNLLYNAEGCCKCEVCGYSKC